MNNFTELNKEKKDLIEKIKLRKKNQINDINVLEEIKKEICNKCIEVFGEHSWIREKETCMYGETYVYCSRCGKDMYSTAIYNI